MRLLDQWQINYSPHAYDASLTDGMSIAKTLGEDPDTVFKTLVTVANTNEHFVFVIPVQASLNLKKAATAAGVKWVEMIKQKELLPLTGYIHGGCSPIGMKKPFRTFIEETASLLDRMLVSAGRVGFQIEVAPSDLLTSSDANYADLT